MTERNYYVVFEDNIGIRTITSYENKEHFNKVYRLHEKESVLEKGVTQEKAIALAQQTSPASRAKHCIRESTDLDGKLNMEILKMEMLNSMEAFNK